MFTMLDDAQKQEFVDGFIAAETALKKYEREATETLVPCINELRYSAYHVAQALKAELNGEVSEKQWQRAIRHTQRAKFDVMEFNVALCMDKVEKIKQSYKGYEFLAGSIIPNYFKHSQALFAISSELESLHELDKESPEFVKVCEKHVRIARAFIKDFYSAEEVLFSEIEKREMEREQADKEKKHDKRVSWIQVLCGAVLGTLFGCAMTLLIG